MREHVMCGHKAVAIVKAIYELKRILFVLIETAVHVYHTNESNDSQISLQFCVAQAQRAYFLHLFKLVWALNLFLYQSIGFCCENLMLRV